VKSSDSRKSNLKCVCSVTAIKKIPKPIALKTLTLKSDAEKNDAEGESFQG